jgi:transcriptional regulator with XRE-family HTH domain
MNLLAHYLTSNELTQTAFARRVEVDQSRISKLCRGEIRPGLDLAHRIERETEGAVPMTAWAKTEGAAQ